MKHHLIKHGEFYFFCIVIALTMYPVLLTKYFSSSDGPAHLYNAKISIELLKSNGYYSTFFSSFFSFNAVPVPNWISNALLIPLSMMLPAYLAEKVLLLAYIILLPLAFRYFITAYKGEILVSYFIFPFVFSFQFCMGFYNFSISLILMFFALGFYLNHEKLFSIRTTLQLSLLLLCTYFAHIFVVVFTITAIAAMFCIKQINQYIVHKQMDKNVSSSLRNLIICFLPASGFIVLFFVNKPDYDLFEYLSPGELIQNLLSIRPAYNSQLEKKFTTIRSFFIFSVLLIGCFLQARKHRTRLKFQSVFHPKLLFLWICLALLVFYFIAPDGDGWAGYVSVRTSLIFFFSLITFISLLNVPKKILYIATISIVILHVMLLSKKYGTLKRNQSRFEELTVLSDNIEAQRTLIPIDLSGQWDVGHLSNYLGVLEKIVIMENYEASTQYFQLVRNKNGTDISIGNLKSGELPLKWDWQYSKTSKPADHVLIIGSSPEKIQQNKELFEQLNQSYYLKKETGFFTLYQTK